jgi:peptidoglycan/LPS O-acetylase OafA/YrhL
LRVAPPSCEKRCFGRFMSTSKNIKYLGGLDDLRGFAALLVVFYHALQTIAHRLQFNAPFNASHWVKTGNPLLALAIEGHTAVGLFLFVSGFVFAFGAAGREVKFVPFLRNRFLRIYPLFLALIFLCGFVFRTKIQLIPLLQTLLLCHEFGGAAELGPLSAMFWALSVEWKCYLLFPFLHRVAGRHGTKHLLGLCVLVALFRLGGTAIGGDQTYKDAYFTLAGRLDQFLLGMVFGYAHAAGKLRGLKYLSPVFLGAVLGAAFLFNRTGGWPAPHAWKFLWPTGEALIWGLLVASYVQLDDRVTRPLRPLRWVGLVSYSVYLIHYPVVSIFANNKWLITFGADPINSAALNTLLVILPVVLAVSVLSYWLIERPAMRLRGTYTAATEARPATRVDQAA